MDRRSWLWRRKSSLKSPGETESSGSMSSPSERFYDDQVAASLLALYVVNFFFQAIMVKLYLFPSFSIFLPTTLLPEMIGSFLASTLHEYKFLKLVDHYFCSHFSLRF